MNLVVIGSGTYAGVIIDVMNRRGWNCIELIDETIPEGTICHGYPTLQKTHLSHPHSHYAFVAIGDVTVREKMSRLPFEFVNVGDMTARMQNNKCRGTFFGPNSYVGHNCSVGNFSIINTGAILEHDSSIGSFSHLCPGAVALGRVKIGDRTTIGGGATIRDGVIIGANCLVAMGSIVTRDIPPNSFASGNPVKIVTHDADWRPDPYNNHQ